MSRLLGMRCVGALVGRTKIACLRPHRRSATSTISTCTCSPGPEGYEFYRLSGDSLIERRLLCFTSIERLEHAQCSETYTGTASIGVYREGTLLMI